MQTLLLKEASALASLPVGQKLLVISGDFHNFKDNDYHLAEKFLPQLCNARERWHDRKCAEYCDVAKGCPYGRLVKYKNEEAA